MIVMGSADDAIPLNRPLHGVRIRLLLRPAFFIAQPPLLLCVLFQLLLGHCQSCIEIGDLEKLVLISFALEIAQALSHFLDCSAVDLARLTGRDQMLFAIQMFNVLDVVPGGQLAGSMDKYR